MSSWPRSVIMGEEGAGREPQLKASVDRPLTFLEDDTVKGDWPLRCRGDSKGVGVVVRAKARHGHSERPCHLPNLCMGGERGACSIHGIRLPLETQGCLLTLATTPAVSSPAGLLRTKAP